MVRALALVVAIAACRHGPVPAPHVTVRFGGDENTAPPTSLVNIPLQHCTLAGAPTPELRDAVIAFARTNLLGELDADVGAGFRAQAVETPTAGSICDDAGHPDGCFTEILVTPRSQVGELIVARRELSSGRCEWGADNVFCLHVSRDASGTSIVITKLGGMVGRNDEPSQSHVEDWSDRSPTWGSAVSRE